jgi:hypothetical protein
MRNLENRVKTFITLQKIRFHDASQNHLSALDVIVEPIAH